MVKPASVRHLPLSVQTPAHYDILIRHHRRDPLDYAFDYRATTWLVDLAALPALPAGLQWLAAFRAADHLGDPGRSLRDNVEDFLLTHGVLRPDRIVMLACPRVLGYVFNPLSLFYCFDARGRYTHAVAEVRNTYGERHCYLLRVDEQGRAETDKQFYVSPFYPVDGRYSMTLPVPGAELLVAVSLQRCDERPFSAVVRGYRRTGPRSCSLWSVLRSPLASRAVMTGIKRHGISLYIKGLRPIPRPGQNPPTTEDEVSPPSILYPDQPDARREGSSMTPVDVGQLKADPLVWPDVVTVPHSPVRRIVARRLVRRAFGNLPIQVHTADGKHFGSGGPHSPQLRIVRPASFYQRLGATGLIGFGEAFMAGDWVSDELADVLTVMAGRMSTLVPPKLQRLRSAVLRARPSSQDNTVDGARNNISRHYDLSNELFTLFLDDSMTYSSALFAGDPDHSAECLTSAQHRKIDRLLDIAGVTEGSRVLEIGTGWGELAIRAAGRGAHVTTVTISTEQAELANKRVFEAGLAELVDVRLQDYREVTGRFDAVVSVEMIEAVGANHWSEYFGAIEKLLVPGGRVGLQAITMPHDRMLASMDTYTWVVKYIFPGGLIPSIRAVRENADAAGLRVVSELNFGLHYAETLRRWRKRFEDRTGEVAELGFDDVFRRMWSLYLAYSEAGFRSHYLDVVQFALVKPRLTEGESR